MSTSIDVAPDATSATLTGLKSDTAYQVTLTACGDAACTDAVALDGAGRTAVETWQLAGEGVGYETAHKSSRMET